ncbi:head scaffolding protein [Vibrio phage K469]
MGIGNIANMPLLEQFVDEDGELVTEARRIRVDSSGQKTVTKKCPAGYKLSPDGKTCVKVKQAEKVARSKGAKRGAKKKVSQQRNINRKTAKAMKKRSQRGL